MSIYQTNRDENTLSKEKIFNYLQMNIDRKDEKKGLKEDTERKSFNSSLS